MINENVKRKFWVEVWYSFGNKSYYQLFPLLQFQQWRLEPYPILSMFQIISSESSRCRLTAILAAGMPSPVFSTWVVRGLDAAAAMICRRGVDRSALPVNIFCLTKDWDLEGLRRQICWFYSGSRSIHWTCMQCNMFVIWGLLRDTGLSPNEGQHCS